MTDKIHISVTVPALSFSTDIPIKKWGSLSDAQRIECITAIVADQVTPYAKVKLSVETPALPKVPTPAERVPPLNGDTPERKAARIAGGRPRTPDIDQLQWSTPRERDGQSH